MTETPSEQTYEGNFLYLFASMVLLILGSSTLGLVGERLAHLIWEMIMLGTLVIGVWSLAHDRKWFVTGMSLSVSIVVLVILAEAVGGSDGLNYLIILCWYLFYLMAFLFTTKAVFSTRRVNANSIVGAVCVYMMAAFLWGMTYSVIALADPAAFDGLDPATPIAGKFSQLSYFSFVTITTLGYGDISPVQPFAQSLALLEAMFGQFFIAIFVAGMVAIHVSGRIDR